MAVPQASASDTFSEIRSYDIVFGVLEHYIIYFVAFYYINITNYCKIVHIKLQ